MITCLVTAERHGQAKYLDMDMNLLWHIMSQTSATIRVLFLPYYTDKPGGARLAAFTQTYSSVSSPPSMDPVYSEDG